eukprot:gb/GECG01015178.1/.p1 GENE.gb/GECG01015178.1/~~gb/GECG01015178.1/.p1  ORF type:complete len:175 (+),score=23.01 gb/GECG01015178.1/:1-525(+)
MSTTQPQQQGPSAAAGGARDDDRDNHNDIALHDKDTRTPQQQELSQRAASEESSLHATSRFLMELEFVQCLANPKYLHYLALWGYFDDGAFVQYLGYLQYFKQPKYAVHLTYARDSPTVRESTDCYGLVSYRFPQCLFFLERLQDKSFREVGGDYLTIKPTLGPDPIAFLNNRL